jgi:hypothetical protein
MANLFAYCATYPKDLKKAEDPIGSTNNRWLSRLDKDAGLSVAAWVNDGGFMGRSTQVRKRLTNLRCIRVNRSGEPAHPLYLKSGLFPHSLN